MFTSVAMMSPMSAMKRKRPMADRSRLMKSPTSDMAPNVPAVTKKVVAMLSMVYAKRMMDSVAPFKTE